VELSKSGLLVKASFCSVVNASKAASLGAKTVNGPSVESVLVKSAYVSAPSNAESPGD